MKAGHPYLPAFAIMVACSRTPVLKGPVVASPVTTQAESNSMPCMPFGSGASAMFPGSVESSRQFTQEDKGMVETAVCKSEDKSQSYTLVRVSRGGRDRPQDSRFIQGLIDGAHGSSIAARRFEDFGLRAVELTGMDNKGLQFIRRHYVAGDGAISIEVVSKTARLDVPAANAFLGSLTIEVPWSIRAFPRAAIAVALPNHGIELGPKELHQDQALLARASLVGGNEARAYSVLAFEIGHNLQGLSIEQRIMLLPYVQRDLGRVTLRSPVDFQGLPGLETLTQAGSQYRRTRTFATNHEIVLLIVSANNPSALMHPDSLRFFESLQCYDQW